MRVTIVLGCFMVFSGVVHAAPVLSPTLNGETLVDGISISGTENLSFNVSFSWSEAEVPINFYAYIDDLITDDIVTGFSGVSCGDGFDISFGDDTQVSCFWQASLPQPETILFSVTVDAPGTYLLTLEFLDSLNGEFFEYEISVTEEETSILSLSSARTQDTNANGYIDAILLDFSDEVDENTISANDVVVEGYTVSSIAKTEATTLSVSLNEQSTFDTNATPTVTVSGIAGLEVEEMEETSITAIDEALPRMVSGILTDDLITIYFTEDLNGNTVNTHTGTDFSLTESIDSVSEVSDGVLALTLATSTAATSTTITLLNEAISDLAGNKNSEHDITLVRDVDTTPITITSVGLTTSASSTDAVMEGDAITLTFLLAEGAATSSATLLAEALSVSQVGTTYTATYTVDATTPTGTVSFSILVADTAGNESSATETTDGSTLTVVREEVEVSDGGGASESSTIPFSISLSADNGGFNLISLPVSPTNTAIENVLAGIESSVQSVWTMIDGSWYVYYPNQSALSNLATMDAGYAYYIEVSQNTTLSGEGVIEENTRTLSSGWEMVGYMQQDESTTGEVSIDTAFSTIGLAGIAYTNLLGYEQGIETTPFSVLPGQGFWMYLAEEGAVIGAPQ